MWVCVQCAAVPLARRFAPLEHTTPACSHVWRRGFRLKLGQHKRLGQHGVECCLDDFEVGRPFGHQRNPQQLLQTLGTALRWPISQSLDSG